MARTTRRSWTTLDERWLHEVAGTIPVSDICRELDRSESSVRHKAYRVGVSLAWADPHAGLVWCDNCGAWRTSVDDDGLCPVCRVELQIEGHKRREREAIDVMTPAQRARYFREKSQRDESRELEVAKRDRNVWKKRVQLAREVTGINPHKRIDGTETWNNGNRGER